MAPEGAPRLVLMTHAALNECVRMGSTTYHRSALVVFLVLEEGFAIPIAVEFIENMEVNALKQDCEIKAFHRLAKK